MLLSGNFILYERMETTLILQEGAGHLI